MRKFLAALGLLASLVVTQPQALATTTAQKVASGGLGPPLTFVDLTDGQPMVGVFAPCAIVPAWTSKGYPTVQVERGWGSGIVQNLYPDASCNLWTRPFGGGQKASVWAGSALLLVNRIYNQAGSNPATDYAQDLALNERVLLNVATSGAPYLAGISTGTQDANQSATVRGYSLPASVTLQTSAAPFSTILAETHANVSTAERALQSSTGTNYWEQDQTQPRHFPLWAGSPVDTYNGSLTPHVLTVWGRNDANGQAVTFSTSVAEGGVYQQGFVGSVSATNYALDILGPVDSLQGAVFAVLVSTSPLQPAAMLNGGIAKNLSSLYAATVAAPSVSYPLVNGVVPMNLSTATATIPVVLGACKSGTAYKAKWNAGSFTSIGTCVNGYLSGSLPAQPAGAGTFTVEEASGANAISISNVAVGVVMAVFGESNPDGRGAMMPVTIPTGSLRKNGIGGVWANWSTLEAYGTQAAPPLNPIVPITSGGLLYSVNDTLTLVGGTGTPAQVKVTSVDVSGAITGLSGVVAGSYSVAPTNPTSVTGGTGTGATLSPTYSQGNQYWLGFVQSLYTECSCVIGIVQGTQGSTLFETSSNTIEGQWSTTPATSQVPAWAAQSRVYLYSAEADFLTPNFVLFDLGLNDMSENTSQAQWYSHGNSLLSFYRNGLNNQSLGINMILSGGQDGSIANSAITPVRTAQLQLWNTAGSGYVPFGSFANISADCGDQVHFCSVATKNELSAIMYRYASNKWLGGPQNRAPQYSSASKAGNQITITFAGGTSPLTVMAADATGWTISDGAGARTVTAVSTTGLSETLTLDQAITGSVMASYCMDKTCIGTTLADSDPTTPLPPEPFGPVTF